jgi:hypothetical protein
MRSPYRHENGETPRTKFVDLEDALKVSVLAAPDAKAFGPVVKSFTEACHCAEPNIPEAGVDVKLEDIVNGQALWQSMETLHFNVLISGCSRVFTHQLVRARVGVTFSQQCFGDHDARHADILLHRCLAKPENAALLAAEIAQALESKAHYAAKIDSGWIPLQAARRSLPHNTSTFIHMHANLTAIAGLFRNRICTMTQDWETVLFARRLKTAILEAAPWAAPALMNPCEDGNCWYHKSRFSGFSTTNFFIPDKVHDTFDWNPKSFIHDATNEEMSSGPVPIQTVEFDGYERLL